CHLRQRPLGRAAGCGRAYDPLGDSGRKGGNCGRGSGAPRPPISGSQTRGGLVGIGGEKTVDQNPGPTTAIRIKANTAKKANSSKTRRVNRSWRPCWATPTVK